jgi:hypothetical protein
MSFPGGRIAGAPLCCQQRPVPLTLRWHGLPFCVLAPQIDIVSPGSVGLSLEVPSRPYTGSGPAMGWAFSAVPGRAGRSSVLDEGAPTAVSCDRSTINGGGVGRAARPAKSPIANNTIPPRSGGINCDLRKRGAQPEQNRLLVHRCQRARSIREPQSEQKLGLYIVRIPS